MTPRVVVLVPRRGDGGWRDRLWAFCRRWWEAAHPEWTIVEGDHLDGPFNRAAAVNAAARAAGEWDVAVVLDADVILHPETVARAVRDAHESGCAWLPFAQRCSLSRPATQRLLSGSLGWPIPIKEAVERQAWNVSTCVVVPRSAWDAVGGFDERFVGWGGEDDAFHAALAVTVGVCRGKGEAWHLWHEASLHRSDEVLYRQALALADRYSACAGIDRRRPGIVRPPGDAMARLLAEDRGDDQVVVVCLTNGRRPKLLAETIESFGAMVSGPVGRRLIVGDGCRPLFPGWETTTISGGNYRRAMREAVRRAIGSGQPWVFWLEDDWSFCRPVDLRAFQAVMEADPSIVQMSLQRQAWYRPEKQVGGIFATSPGAFDQRDGWVAHRRYWTQNPMLTRRSTLAEHPWPQVPQSEWRFAELVLGADPDRVAGVWGALDDDPWVTHLGKVRAGSARGY